jgi:hypothetical protein
MRDERKLLARRGARAHPRSGAGTIKRDGSTRTRSEDEPGELFEIKTARSQHTMKAADLAKLHQQAARQGQVAGYVVHFPEHGISVECRVKRENLDGWE